MKILSLSANPDAAGMPLHPENIFGASQKNPLAAISLAAKLMWTGFIVTTKRKKMR